VDNGNGRSCFVLESPKGPSDNEGQAVEQEEDVGEGKEGTEEDTEDDSRKMARLKTRKTSCHWAHIMDEKIADIS